MGAVHVAVVGREHDDGLVADAHGVERVEQSLELVVEERGLRVVAPEIPARHVGAVGPSLDRGRVVHVQIALRDQPVGMVRRPPGKEQAERVVAPAAPQVVDGVRGLGLGIPARPDLQLTRVVGVTGAVVVVLEVGRHPVPEPLPARAGRYRCGTVRAVEVPLADVGGVVARGVEAVRDAGLGGRERDVVEHQAGRGRRAAGQQGAAVGPAHRQQGNGVGAYRAGGGEGVQVGRRDRLLPRVADGATPQLIGEDEEYVGPLPPSLVHCRPPVTVT